MGAANAQWLPYCLAQTRPVGKHSTSHTHALYTAAARHATLSEMAPLLLALARRHNLLRATATVLGAGGGAGREDCEKLGGSRPEHCDLYKMNKKTCTYVVWVVYVV